MNAENVDHELVPKIAFEFLRVYPQYVRAYESLAQVVVEKPYRDFVAALDPDTLRIFESMTLEQRTGGLQNFALAFSVAHAIAFARKL